jgi:hypothetical protein
LIAASVAAVDPMAVEDHGTSECRTEYNCGNCKAQSSKRSEKCHRPAMYTPASGRMSRSLAPVLGNVTRRSRDGSAVTDGAVGLEQLIAEVPKVSISVAWVGL